MSLRVPIEALADSIPALRASGVVAVEVGDCELAERCDTIPAPPTMRTPHPETFPPPLSSDEVARGYGWIADPSEPAEFEIAFGMSRPSIDTHFVARNAIVTEGIGEPECEQLCGGANVGARFR